MNLETIGVPYFHLARTYSIDQVFYFKFHSSKRPEKQLLLFRNNISHYTNKCTTGKHKRLLSKTSVNLKPLNMLSI